ncbi:MAG: mechanosensitive ion channel domain-containing protein [Pseudomonadota bacterium]
MRIERFIAALRLTVLAFFAAGSISLSAAAIAPGAGSDGTSEASESAAEPVAEDVVGESPLNPLNDPSIGLAALKARLIPLTNSDLEELSANWQQLAREAAEDLVDAQVAIDESADGNDEAAREAYAVAYEELGSRLEKFSAVLDGWEEKAGDPDQIAQYRAYRDAIVAEFLKASDTETLIREATDWVKAPDGGQALLYDLAVILASLIALWVVARVIRAQVRGWLSRSDRLSGILISFLATLTYWLVLIVGLAITMAMLGVDVTPIFALIGGASFILAFAFQDTLGNFASGLMIMFNQPFDEGDVVELDGVVGKVEALTIVATTIKTADNKVIVLPNRAVWGNLIQNMTATTTRRVDLVFGISYEDSMEDAMAIMRKVTQAHPSVLEEPDITIRVHELADSSVNFICRPWVKTEDYWNVYWDLTQQVKTAFDEAGISIPYPQSDVHLRAVPQEISNAS